MALLDGLLGGGSADPYDLYGDILTAKQREALRARSSDQTWANAANFLAKAAMPTNKKIPLGGLLAGLAGAMGGSNQDEAVNTAFNAAKTAEAIKTARQARALNDQISPILLWMARNNIDPKSAAGQQILGGGGVSPAAGAPAVPPTAPAAATTPPPMMVPPQPPVPAGGLPGLPPGATTALPATTQLAGLLGGGAPGSGGGDDDILSAIAALSQGGGGGSPAPFDLASLGTSQGLPDVGQVRVEPLSGEASPAGRSWERDDPLIRKYESGSRNIMQGVVGPQGGYNPSVGRVTGPSSAGGYYQMIDPTWRGAAAKAGVDTKEYPRAIDAPFEVQQKVAKRLYEDEGLRPWAPYNRNLAAATGYSGSFPDVGRVNIEPLGGEAAPAGGGGVIPGLGMTPQGLAALNALTKMGGLGEPFGSLLETYYKSPGYLEEKARIEKTAESKVSLEYGPLIKAAETAADMNTRLKLEPQLQAAIEKAKNDPKLAFEEKKAIIERLSKEQEQIRAAGLEPVSVTVTFPGETTPREITITKGQLPDLTSGKGVPALGIPPMSGVKLGKPVERPEDLKQQEIDQRFLEEKRVQAESSRRAIMAANDTRQLIEKGVIAGSYADERTRLLKLGQLLNLTGKDDNDRIRQTEAYIANLGRGMKEGLKGLGPPVSNVDIQIAEKIAGGQNLTTQGMLELLKLEEKYHRLALQDYGKLLSSAPKSRYDKSVKEPPTFGAPIADSPEGVAHWWDGKAWRPL